MNYQWYKSRPPTTLPIDGGFIRPFWNGDLNNFDLMETLRLWRGQNREAYPSRPTRVTPESFYKWAKSVQEKPDRILFLVLSEDQVPVGHLGYNNGNEIDNVVRGDKSAAKGIMTAAMKWVLEWGEDVCFLEDIYLRVFLDNRHAVEFYERLEFKHGDLIPLKRVDHDWGYAYEEGEPAEKTFLKMHYLPESKANIYTSGPSISQREVEYAADSAFQLNRNYTGYVRRLEDRACDYLGCKYALATSSCTGAMHLVLEALGVKQGSVVSVPEITWVATASVVAYTGATPKFEEVMGKSWCMDYEKSGTPSIAIAVHLYGHLADVEAIDSPVVIEDAAAAMGAEYYGKKAGTVGLAGCFSFQGAKLLTASEGGLIVTNHEWLYDAVRKLNDHGRDPSRTFWIDRLGFKYKMSNMQAAVALAQMERIDELLEKKRRIHEWYMEMLSDTGVVFQKSSVAHEPAHWMVSCLVPSRDALMAQLKKDGIDTRPVFPRISEYPIWGMRRERDVHPVSELVSTQGVNLPSGVTLRKRDIERVCASVRKALICLA